MTFFIGIQWVGPYTGTGTGSREVNRPYVQVGLYVDLDAPMTIETTHGCKIPRGVKGGKGQQVEEGTGSGEGSRHRTRSGE